MLGCILVNTEYPGNHKCISVITGDVSEGTEQYQKVTDTDYECFNHVMDTHSNAIGASWGNHASHGYGTCMAKFGGIKTNKDEKWRYCQLRIGNLQANFNLSRLDFFGGFIKPHFVVELIIKSTLLLLC